MHAHSNGFLDSGENASNPDFPNGFCLVRGLCSALHSLLSKLTIWKWQQRKNDACLSDGTKMAVFMPMT